VRKLFRQCLATDHMNCYEYTAAKAALRRMELKAK